MALGKGLGALFKEADITGGASREKKDYSVSIVPIDNVIPNPNQPRKVISREALEELAQSIRTDGIIQPLLVRKSKIAGRYELISGERRLRASKLANLTEVPVYIREMSDNDVMVAMVIENIQRQDLNAAEQARALQELKEKLGLTQEELAERLGMSRPFVANSLRLLKLPQTALDRLQQGEISAGHARCLLALAEDEKTLLSLLNRIISDKISIRACEDAVMFWKQEGRLPWSDAVPVPETQKQISPKKKSEDFRKTEKALSSIYGCKAKLSGTHDEGKLSIAFKSREELLKILTTLGVEDQLTESSLKN